MERLQEFVDEALDAASQGRDREVVKQLFETALLAATRVARRHKGKVDEATLI